MRNLIQLSVDELQSFEAGECMTCNQLRRGLKEATMYSLLASTWTHLYSKVTAETQLRNAEINLTFALKDLREHRRDRHATNHFSPSWIEAAHRRVS